MIMNGPHVRIVQRQGLGGGGLLGGLNSAVSNAGSDLTSAVAGAGSDLTSGLGDITSAVIPTTSASTASSTTPISTTQTSSTTLQSTSSTSTFTSTRSSSSTSSSSSSSSSTSSSSTSSSTTTSSSSASVVVSTSDGVKETITAFVTSSASPSPSSTPSSSPGGFLNNKPLEGFVFALCGIVGIVIVVLVATFALRRSRRKKMINEALSYEPTTTHGYRDEMDRGLTEKARHSYSSHGSLGSGNGPPVTAYPGTYGHELEYPAYAPRSPVPYGPPYGGGPAYGVNQMGPAHAQSNLPRVPAPAMSTDIRRV